MKKSKKYYKFRTKKIPIYGGVLALLMTNDKKRVRKRFSRIFEKGDTPFAHSTIINHEGYRGNCIILNFDHGWANITHGTISHEAYYITSFIADYVGMKHDPYNDEAMAYLHGWIVDQLYKWIKKEGFKIHVDG